MRVPEGSALPYAIEALAKKDVVGIAGFRGQFLILGSMEPDGTVRLLQVEDDVQPGAPVV